MNLIKEENREGKNPIKALILYQNNTFYIYNGKQFTMDTLEFTTDTQETFKGEILINKLATQELHNGEHYMRHLISSDETIKVTEVADYLKELYKLL